MERSTRALRSIVVAAAVILLQPLPSFASEALPDRWGLSLGGFKVDSVDTTAASVPINTPIGVGTVINLNRNLNVEDSDNSFRFDGYYRFNDRHRIDFSYYEIKVSGERTIQENFSWEGQDYVAGMRIGSFWETKTSKLGYLFSFHHDNKVELGLGGGLHITDLAIGLDVLAFAASQGDQVQEQFNRSAVLDATAPVPYLSFLIQYDITRRWAFRWKYDALRLSFNDISGIMTDSLASVEHHTFKHVGFGLGFNAFRIDIDGEDGDKAYVFNNSFDGVLLYVKAYF